MRDDEDWQPLELVYWYRDLEVASGQNERILVPVFKKLLNWDNDIKMEPVGCSRQECAT